MSAQTAIIFLSAWTLLSIAAGFILGCLIPRSPEPDEHEACAGDPEVLRGVQSQAGAIGHFHTIHEEAFK